MKIFLIPYSLKLYIDSKKRHSGVDMAMLSQFKILKSLGHDVRLFIPFTDLIEDGIIALSDKIDIDFDRVTELMFKNIVDFKPDIIYSNHFFTPLYKMMINFKIPIIYNSHAVPGFWTDYNNIDPLNSFILSGHSLLAVSNYHKLLLEKYFYNKTKTNLIVADDVLFPQYSIKHEAVAHDNTVRHISAASKEKQTFLLNEILAGEAIKFEIFTNISYLGGSKNAEYVETSLRKIKNKDSVKLNVDHSTIMESIKSSVCIFVGLASFDSFTITSLESLSRGIPLIVKDKNGLHPAQEMLGERFANKYIHCYTDKKDFIKTIERFSKLSLDERQEIADETYALTSEIVYKKNLEKILQSAIKKFNGTDTKVQLEKWF